MNSLTNACSLRAFPALLAIILFTGLLSSCIQEGLYDTADGVPVVYALADNAGVGTLVIAAESGYYREYVITGLPTPAPQDLVFADNDRRVFAAHFSDVYYTPDRDPSESWNMVTVPAGTILDIETLNSETLLLVQNTADCLYRFDKSMSNFLSMGKNVTNTTEFMDLDRNNNVLYVSTNTGGNSDIYYLTSAPALVFISPTIPAAPTRTFFSVIAGDYFVGNNISQLYSYSGGLIGTGTAGFQSYAFLGDSVYAADDNEIFRLNKSTSTFQAVFSGFTDTGNTIELAPLDDETLAVGVYKGPSGPDNGLYIYNTKKNALKRLSSLKVVALYVKR